MIKKKRGIYTMWKLVSPKDEWKWSFLNGYHIFKNVVYLLEKDDVSKYHLIDEKGNKVDCGLEKYLEEC